MRKGKVRGEHMMRGRVRGIGQGRLEQNRGTVGGEEMSCDQGRGGQEVRLKQIQKKQEITFNKSGDNKAPT